VAQSCGEKDSNRRGSGRHTGPKGVQPGHMLWLSTVPVRVDAQRARGIFVDDTGSGRSGPGPCGQQVS